MLASIFIPELVGTAMLLLLGCGVVANTALTKTKGNGTGFLFVNWGWGIGVFAGVLVSIESGGHINPAVTVGLVASGSDELAPGIPTTAMNVLIYIVAQMIGAIIGATLVWLAYRDHFDEEPDAGSKLAVFSTSPGIRKPFSNVMTEVIATFVLVFTILAAGGWGDAEVATPAGLGWLSALGVALLVVGIGASLGGPTGYAINPARDLGPRIAHAILPIKGKGSSDWGYSWVPVLGPIIGGVLAGLASMVLLP